MQWEMHRLDLIFRLAMMGEWSSFARQGVGEKGISGREKNSHADAQGERT